MKAGDLVRMRRGYSQPGLALEIVKTKDWVKTGKYRWVRVLWPEGTCLEKIADMEVIDESG
jgi:hypothetical protein|tara:strand:- start:14016 stop:14198 length:183 start_codon:yes stop_codon:yes gene_type:complete